MAAVVGTVVVGAVYELPLPPLPLPPPPPETIKLAVIDSSPLIVVVVVELVVLATLPVHDEKAYPVDGVAVRVTTSPWL